MRASTGSIRRDLESVLNHYDMGSYSYCIGANSTGVYSGVAITGNGAGVNDPDNMWNTFLRGVQKTEAEGTVSFKTLIPGHYAGRATHTHVMIHPDTTTYPNGTLFSEKAMYAGQIYFDQELLHAVEQTRPYKANAQPVTLNKDDLTFNIEEITGTNPIMEYVLLGDDVADGVLGWMTLGVNTSSVREVYHAAAMYESGPVQVETATNSSGADDFMDIIFGPSTSPSNTAVPQSRAASSRIISRASLLQAVFMASATYYI